MALEHLNANALGGLDSPLVSMVRRSCQNDAKSQCGLLFGAYSERKREYIYYNFLFSSDKITLFFLVSLSDTLSI